MSVRGKRIGCLTLWGLLLVSVTTGPGWAVDVGDKAPDFTLPSTTGGSISLSQFRGKKLVLIEFYVRDFAPI